MAEYNEIKNLALESNAQVEELKKLVKVYISKSEQEYAERKQTQSLLDILMEEFSDEKSDNKRLTKQLTIIKDDMEELQEKYEVIDEAYKCKKQQLKESNKNLQLLNEKDFGSIIKQDEEANQSFCSARTMRSTPDRDQEFMDSSPIRDGELSPIEVFTDENDSDDVIDLGILMENRKEHCKDGSP